MGLSLVGLAALLFFLLLPLRDEHGPPAVPLPPQVVGGDATPQPFQSPIVYPDPDALTEARVLRVIDGDTIEVDLAGRTERVRYYGVDSPERDQRCYQEAKAWNQVAVGDEVRLLPDARERDRYGRLLRYVFTPEGESVDAAMVVAGVAIAWRDDGAYRDQIVELEQSARQAEVGCLWSPPGDNDNG